MRTTEQLICAMLQRLGKSPSNSVRTYEGKEYTAAVNLVHCLNDAGRQLVTEQPWSWLDRTVTIPLVEGKDSYDLPAGTVSLESAGFVGAGTRAGVMVPFDTVLESRRRVALMNGATEYQFALGGGVQRTKGLPAVRTLEMYPAPGASAPSCTVTLKLGWVDLTIEDPDRVPALPATFDRAIFLAARRMAWKDQNNTPSPDEAEYRAEVERLWEIDQREQPDMGPIQGDLCPINDDTPDYRTGRFTIEFN